jgi:hypothetical protein
MPPKRKALDTVSTNAAPAKKAKAGEKPAKQPNAPKEPTAPKEPKASPASKFAIEKALARWSKPISGSRNAEASYLEFINDDAKAFDYECRCNLDFLNSSYDEDEDEDEEDRDAEDASKEHTTKPQREPTVRKRADCDRGKTCVCTKPAADFPKHPWTLSNAGFR